MNLGRSLLFFLFFTLSLYSMDKKDKDSETDKQLIPAAASSEPRHMLPVSIVLPHTQPDSYLRRLSPDLWGYFWPFLSRLTQPLDNHGDIIMQTHARAREIARMICSICNVDLVSNVEVNKNFLLASESFVREHDDEVNSFYLPNHISLACALGTDGAREALKREIKNQMEAFRTLHQDDKNKLLLDVMRRLPAKVIVRNMLANGAQVNCRDAASGYTPLRYAVEEVKKVKKMRNGKEEIITRARMSLVKLLLKKQADPTVSDKSFTTPLHRACILGDEKLVRMLARKSRAINALNIFGYNALAYAARSGNPTLVRTLLRHGARVIFSDGSQLKNVFVSAVEGDSLEVLQILLEQRDPGAITATLNLYLNAALKRAAELGRALMVAQLLLVKDKSLCPDGQFINLVPDFLINNETALSASLQHGYPEIALMLLHFARDRYYKQLHDKARSLAVALAVFKMHQYKREKNDEKTEQYIKALACLLEDDDPNPLGNEVAASACFIAASHKNLVLLNELLVCAQKREINCQMIALQEAIQRQNPIAVHTILETDFNLNQCDSEKQETIFFKTVTMVKREALELIDYLIAAGADASKPTITRLTPAHAVMANPDERCRLYILEELYRRRIIDAADDFGDTPLHLACCRKPFMIDTVAALLQYQANPNATNSEGNTPLIYAAGEGSEELVAMLLRAGADPNLRNNSGCGALTKAAKHGSKKLISLLVAAGAKIEDFKNPMLRQAAKGNHVALMRELLEIKADINGESTSLGNTPLHKAVNNLSHEAVAFLLEKGANVNAKNREGKTPRELAMSSGDSEIMQRLLEHT